MYSWGTTPQDQVRRTIFNLGQTRQATQRRKGRGFAEIQGPLMSRINASGGGYTPTPPSTDGTGIRERFMNSEIGKIFQRFVFNRPA